LTHRDRSEYKTHSSVMAVCKSVTIPGMTGHVRRNTQVPKELMAQVLEMMELDPERYAHLKELDLEASIEKAKNWISAQQSWKNR